MILGLQGIFHILKGDSHPKKKLIIVMMLCLSRCWYSTKHLDLLDFCLPPTQKKKKKKCQFLSKSHNVNGMWEKVWDLNKKKKKKASSLYMEHLFMIPSSQAFYLGSALQHKAVHQRHSLQRCRCHTGTEILVAFSLLLACSARRSRTTTRI